MAASGDDGVVEVGVDVPQVPIALFSEIGLPRQEGADASPRLPPRGLLPPQPGTHAEPNG